MNLHKDMINWILAIVIIAILVVVSVIGIDNAEREQEEYTRRRELHVIETWWDGKDHDDHTCEYGPEWCNPNYCEFLLKRRWK